MFTAVSSTVIAFLVYESPIKKLIASVATFIVLLYALHTLHPGSAMVSFTGFMVSASISFLGVTVIAYGSPSFFSEGSNGQVKLRNMVIPILSVAKRGLRRRWLRFVLTLFSVLLLVTSFISLTSFASGYGLSLTNIKEKEVTNQGIMIRTPNPPPTHGVSPFSGGEGVGGPTPLDPYLISWFNDTELPIVLSAKYQNIPMRQYREAHKPYATLNGASIFGVMAVNPYAEAIMTGLQNTVEEGNYLNDTKDTAMISESLASKLNLSIGDVAILIAPDKALNLTIVALLNDNALSKVIDLDGEPILPQKIIEESRIVNEGAPDYITEALVPCDPIEVVIINQVTASNFSTLWINRIDMTFGSSVDLTEFASKTALDRGFMVWASTDNGIVLAQLAGYFQGKGLPILVPLIIVILNVIVTILNSYYERRHEIMIYSSIGMNPRHISSIFLAEAAVIGIIGGSIGYLLGLGAYKLIYVVTPTLQVEQKVSAFWSVAAIGISLTAVLIGGIVALANSTAITPSLKRRWRATMKSGANEPVTVILPIHVFETEINRYMDFLMNSIREASKNIHLSTKMLKMVEVDEADGHRWEISFIYSAVGISIAGVYTRNNVTVRREKDGSYSTVLVSTGDGEGLQSVGSFMRNITLNWSVNRSDLIQVEETNLSHMESELMK